MMLYGISIDEVRQKSREQALSLLEQNRLARKIFGLIRSPRLLEQAYKEKDVQLLIIAGDIINGHIEADAAGFNEVMDPEILKKHGPNFFEQVFEKHQELKKLNVETGKISRTLYFLKDTVDNRFYSDKQLRDEFSGAIIYNNERCAEGGIRKTIEAWKNAYKESVETLERYKTLYSHDLNWSSFCETQIKDYEQRCSLKNFGIEIVSAEVTL